MAEFKLTPYIFNNPLGNRQMGTWNVLPAVLTTWSNLLTSSGSNTIYSMYQQQAQNYIDTAKMNAEIIHDKGAIALRNLEYKHTLERGQDVAKVGAAGGHLSGTTLDVLVQKEKIRKTDETTVKANYMHQEMLTLYNGYHNAGNAYGALASKATADKANVWASILKGVQTYVGMTSSDITTQAGVDANNKVTEGVNEQEVADMRRRYTRDNLPNTQPDSSYQILFPSEASSTSLNNIINPQYNIGTDMA